MINVQIYRYHPEYDTAPYMQSKTLPEEFRKRMVLDALQYLREEDPTLAYRRSCREGVCGSDGMNINGKNWLACIKPVADALGTSNTLVIRPLPGMPVIRDLVVDQSLFFSHYEKIKPWLINDDPAPAIERLQTPEQRKQLDGLYECILCGCCTSQCPSWWWNPEKYRGPSALLQSLRFLLDSRDRGRIERMDGLQDPFSVFRCRSIGNCTWVCPKGLNPMGAIGRIRLELMKEST
ncbi:MAG TPA: succinate dehydrogenase iron-sulfur subunit [Marinospirillum sp.]|jgi:succinate dehydrogenase / fumarate reductase iron-sulfur subunit|uniref:succinate dehydrogenase iron-sulfur subunit n=1 Tax=Marinospirillum sp. TaxID=2183934 RepID=UPI000A64C37B|nr:succinate dehydrogenase iron-sulfur subunit [Marinospirillum sp.]MCK9533701.1 succinate dehydrogenase iron-sulfur subunit [Pseudomonas sp.]NLO52913.1 succinate dehydrogenase iron-sulfur subunit [Gammaproteobacteria bacterium]MDD2222721.1 succinate dehydrogenase iron-sulfur subunit [Pseudomonas sp.]MDY0415260.1 succinate dehydrogenase iron-sulfur subunit [Pseudomonas sp.]HKM14820.1 succinate dehydrogenase iron-sulfur subunit [Marinospirillum sp.]